MLKKSVITIDDFTWRLPSSSSIERSKNGGQVCGVSGRGPSLLVRINFPLPRYSLCPSCKCIKQGRCCFGLWACVGDWYLQGCCSILTLTEVRSVLPQILHPDSSL